MPSARLIVAVAAAMLLAQIHCIAACTTEVCSAPANDSQSVPPCHKHHNPMPGQDSGSCSLRLVISAATSPDVPQLHLPAVSVIAAVPAVSDTVLINAQPQVVVEFSDSSPPGAPELSSTILRV